LRRIFDFGPESAKTLDWVADDAVLCELLSVNLSTGWHPSGGWQGGGWRQSWLVFTANL